MQYMTIVIYVLSINSCYSKKDTTSDIGAIPVKAISVCATDVYSDNNYVGVVEESSASSLTFSLPGSVERVLVDEGSRVSKGELLAVLDKTTLQSAYDAALSTLNQAKDASARLKLLYDNGSLPEIKWVEVQSSLQQALSMKQIAMRNLENIELRAPFSGVISQRNIEAGVNVLPGVPAFKLVKIDNVDVNIAVPENEISSTQKGDAVKINVAALGGKVFEGKVTERGVIANLLSHTYKVKIRLANPNGELMPGMVCNVYITKGKGASQIVIPNKAVQIKYRSGHFVWVIDNGVAAQREITVGGLTGGGVIVTSGLSPGDKVIVEGNQKVSERMKVEVQ